MSTETETRSIVRILEDGASLTFERYLVQVEEGPDKGREIALPERATTLGRSQQADVTLNDPSVSREHAVLEPSGIGLRIRDLESKSGTFVDGTAIKEAILKPGCRIRIGETVLELRLDAAELRCGPGPRAPFPGIVGANTSLRQLFALVEKVAAVDMPVLVTGETGTGKEQVARAIHDRSGCKDGPYQVVDCTLLEGEHLRSELFGHRKGSFTGATADRAGAAKLADGGTLFLDEVGEIPLELQPQLLRLLEQGEVRPLGADRSTRVQVRVLAATHRNLEVMIREGSFRADLYHRLSALCLEVPPVRDRGQDVVALGEFFLAPGFTFSEGARAALLAYSWPGNVRELRNTVQRACVMADQKVLEASDLRLVDDSVGGGAPGGLSEETSLEASVSDHERRVIQRALEKTGGNRKEAAVLLGISRSSLYRKLEEHGLS